MASPKTTERRVMGSLQRAFDILDLFSASYPELGITEIAQRLELHKSTASGLIYSLEEGGYLDQNPENRKYRLGLKFLERTTVLLGQLEIRDVARPFLLNLRNWSQESINLAIHDENEVVYVERYLSEQGLSYRNVVGKRAFVHTTALGKAILSELPLEEAEQILKSYKFESKTEYTFTTIEDVLKDLIITKERGFAIDNQENGLGGRCVASSIFNHLGQPIAAVSISVPLPRIPEEKIPYYGNKVNEVANEISLQLGYRPSKHL